ncbi:MAG: sugar ABC transporter permease [Clostridiaceae bacterium]|nr:sugar ABC transporter permease [Clostridiaceae bacterium]
MFNMFNMYNRIRTNKIVKKVVRHKWLYLLLIPVIAYYFIFCYIPIYGVTIAFKDYNMFKGIFGSKWVGFDNFKRIFSTSDFYRVVRNTFMLNLSSLVVGFPGPIILALLLNEVRVSKFKKLVQNFMYLPHFLSWVVIANIFIPMLSPSRGIINMAIKKLGGSPVYFMGNKIWWIAVYVGLGIWKEVGWSAIIYLAALTGIDQQLYEAAIIDGAGKWKQCLNVTIPGIAPTISVMLILRMGHIMNIGFDQAYLLGNNMVTEVSEVISTYVYSIGIVSLDISRSSAIGFFQSIVCLVTLLISNYASKKISGESIY